MMITIKFEDIDAAHVYDIKAFELFGPNAKTNFPKEYYEGLY